MKKTIILQGPTAGRTTHPKTGNSVEWDIQQVINIIRSWYSRELILSTWEGQKHNFYGLDKVVQAEDPGPGPFNGRYPMAQHCNLVRQIVGLKAGLEAADGELIFKVRNDCFVSKNVFNFFEKRTLPAGSMTLFKNKITVGNIMTINPDYWGQEGYFRISDWMHLGMKEDLLKMCDALDVIQNNDFGNSFLGTEQILLLSLLQKNGLLDIDLSKTTSTNLEQYNSIAWDVILQNFKVVNTISTAGVQNVGRWQSKPETFGPYLTEQQYNRKLEQRT